MAAAPKKVPGIRVVAKADGFRRAGRAWSKEGTELPASSLTRAELAALRAEPKLVVTEIDVAAEAAE